MSEYMIHPANRRTLGGEQERIEAQIQRLQQQAEVAAQNYRRELERLSRDYERSANEANQTLRNNHRQALDAISAAYNAQRAETRREIEHLRNEYNRQLEESNRTIIARIQGIESRLETQAARDRAVADDYRGRARAAWARLRDRTELKPFIDRHAGTIEQTNATADEIYARAQYQAVTAIMVNSSALIRVWEEEAQSLWEEWQDLYRLCEAEMNCMRSAMAAAADQPVDCDGRTVRSDLRRYDPAGFEAAGQTLASDEAVFADARRLMIEDMRVLLHNLERDRHGVDRLLDRATSLHRAHVRRLRCLRTVSKGLASREYRQVKTLLANSSLNDGIRALFSGRLTRVWIVLDITTPQPENGVSRITVRLLPGAAMDESLQRRMCEELSFFAAGLLEGQAYRPAAVSAGNVFRDQNRLYQAQLEMQYQI